MAKIPAACADLDLAQVSRVLAKHFGDIPAAARELKIPTPDLRRLIWAKPHLLDEAHEEMELFVARAWSELIKALDSDDPRRRRWGADRIMSSWLARDHPLARARRRAGDPPREANGTGGPVSSSESCYQSEPLRD